MPDVEADSFPVQTAALLAKAAAAAAAFRSTLADRPVGPVADQPALSATFGGPLPVTLSPAAMAAEEAAGSWLKQLLGIPSTASVGFVGGGQEGNTVGLAAARHHVLSQTGRNVARDGLMGASRVRIVAGHERHATIDRSLGLWAAASPTTRHLVDGIGLADSWSCDGHKWLNVPYDAGYAFCSRPDVHAAAVSYTATYLTASGTGAAAGADYTLASSRRARGFATWAALRHLGTEGTAELVDRCCSHARRFARALTAAGLNVVNEVVLNQVLVEVGDQAETERVISAVQRDGTCWLGGTTWRGRRLLRISVSNWSTTSEDVDRSVEAILRAAAGE